MSNEVQKTDVTIVGAGPVGLFAVFECGMLKMRCHVVDALPAIGGQCSTLYPEKPIYDIPGHPAITGQELVDNLERQIAPFQPTFHLGQQAVSLRQSGDGGWMLETSDGTRIESKAVIVAAGVGAFGPNRPPLAGIELYEQQPPGSGVQYMVRRKEDFRGRHVVIAGGGDSAVDWAIALSDVAHSLHVIHRRPKFRAAPESASRLQALAEAGKIDLVIPYQLGRLEGAEGRLRAVVAVDLEGNERTIKADALLPFYGLSQDLGPILEWNLNLDSNHVTVDPTNCRAGPDGIYAIGDIVNYPGKLKLILTGFAEAAVAAHQAHHNAFPGQALHFEYSTSRGVPGVK